MKTNIKTILLAPILFLISLLAMTSCDTMIASSLEGTWTGDMYMCREYAGKKYYSTHCEIEFVGDPYHVRSGFGYWVDHYSNAPWDYTAYHFDWTVEDRVIKIHFREDDYYVEIHDYDLDDRYFTGYVFYDGEDQRFELYHTSSPNWSEYRYGEYANSPYYSPSRAEVNDSVPTSSVRHMRRAQ